jgi:hypothetical protein
MAHLVSHSRHYGGRTQAISEISMSRNEAARRHTVRALDLVGKGVRVWYASARKWKVVTVQHVLFGPAPGVPEGAYFRVTRARKVNPYYYSMAELEPLEGKTLARRSRTATRKSPTGRARKGGPQCWR